MDESTDELVTLPDKKNVPATGALPSHHEPFNNLAKDDELAASVQRWASRGKERFDVQEQRKEFMTMMGVADRMYRMALRKDTTSKQYQNTLSNVTSTAFYRALRAVNAGEREIFNPGDELPAKFMPEVNTTEYSTAQGEDIAKSQNMLEEHTWDEDKRTSTVNELIEFVNKYGNYVVWEEWDRVEDERTERVITERDENDNATAYDWGTVKRVIKDCPSLKSCSPEYIWADATIDDMQKQSLIVHRGQVSYNDLVLMQEAGLITNVDKLKPHHLYAGEDEDVLEDRLTNAAESTTVSRNGLYEFYHVWGMCPVKEFKRKGKGKWDEAEMPTRYWATYIGDLTSSNAVCVRLRKNPRHDRRVPYNMIHSHRDDKGLYHDGFADQCLSLYWQAVTSSNMAIDNSTLINQTPWVLTGQLASKLAKFRANSLTKLRNNSTLQQLVIKDSTQSTTALFDRVERDIMQTTGADKPIVGEALGSRTSATEAKQVKDSASLPMDDKSAYFAEQTFDWLLEMDAADWRQYGDPNTMIKITMTDDMQDVFEVNPAELYGPIKTKVTAVTRYRNKMQSRSERNIFIQNAYPLAQESMGDEGVTNFWRDTFKLFGYENPARYFPDDVGYESELRAKDVLRSIMLGEDVQPDPRVNHRIWLRVFKPFVREYELIGEGRDEAILTKLRQMVVAHENFAAQKAQDQAAAIQGTQGAPEGLPGEIAGNEIEAREGALANV